MLTESFKQEPFMLQVLFLNEKVCMKTKIEVLENPVHESLETALNISEPEGSVHKLNCVVTAVLRKSTGISW